MMLKEFDGAGMEDMDTKRVVCSQLLVITPCGFKKECM
jgi:hypothetical protein